GVLAAFDRAVGLERLSAVHLNDSMNARGSRKDRHEKIGDGYIGLEAFKNIVTHPVLKTLPCFLETPNELSGYAKEIALLKSF
ncbi:MAG: endonuclease IV, partial [Ruminococcus sp.]|nr:endonuclease IV [Ruminococcus sp.]